jgi:hypothetical protein
VPTRVPIAEALRLTVDEVADPTTVLTFNVHAYMFVTAQDRPIPLTFANSPDRARMHPAHILLLERSDAYANLRKWRHGEIILETLVGVGTACAKVKPSSRVRSKVRSGYSIARLEAGEGRRDPAANCRALHSAPSVLQCDTFKARERTRTMSQAFNRREI